ncbi:peptidase U32 [Vulcanibacillus modesticaldus]|uniref:Peptidase U32 n=1 Tax=Vulcanibacillus modesticaldus TaxID=337097 RepID=A0A1D2YT89_9BACI|nr:peptidase U32 family protein [Vulcanibacillus modesticaldus]OEF98910.1 peptidase U32 [Vulcanibacillus modesticaldus]
MNLKKPELLITAKNLDEIKYLADSGADAFNIGGDIYGLRVAGIFTLEMIKEAVKIAKEKQKKIYVMMNAILHNDSLNGLEDYLTKLVEYDVDGIVFGDPAVFITAKEIAPDLQLHLNTETTITNAETINFWAKRGVTRAVLARELSLEEVIDIKNKVNIEIQVQVHGLTCIFHSKRSLLTNYFEHLGYNKLLPQESRKKQLHLREKKRPDERYPIFEDSHGTHIMSDHDICMIEHIDKFIGAGIDSLKIEGILHSTDYLVNVTKLYRKAIDNVLSGKENGYLVEQIKKIQPKNRPLNTGFYFKEQIY